MGALRGRSKKKIVGLLISMYLGSSIIFLSGCNTITKRIYPKLNKSNFQGDGLNGKVLVKYLLCGGEHLRYFENEMRDSIIESGAFSEIKMKNINLSCEDLAINNTKEFLLSEIPISAFSNENLTGFEYEINLIIKLEMANTHFIKNILKIFTFLVIPAEQEFGYKVAIEIQKVGDEKNSNMIFLNEKYNVEKSIIPTGSEHFRLTWEKEPVANLLKVAIKKYQDAGILK